MARMGIKSEIHECTIEIVKLLEKMNLLPSNFSSELGEDKQLRVDNQYYLRDREVNIDYKFLLDFISSIKSLIDSLSRETINEIRNLI